MRPTLLIIMLACGCQADEARLDAIESKLRDDPTRGGKVGYVRGLEVRQRARQLLARPAFLPCQLPEGDRRTTITFRELAGDQVVASTVETRQWRPNSQSLLVTIQMNEAPPTLQAWRLRDNQLVHRDQTSDVWFRREAQPNDASWLREQGTLPGQWMIDLAPGWGQDGDGWGLGTQSLRCEDAVSRRAANERLSARGRLVEGRVRMSASAREVRLAFERQDGARVEVAVEERVMPLPELEVGPTIASPEVVSVDARFEAWEKSGLILREREEP